MATPNSRLIKFGRNSAVSGSSEEVIATSGPAASYMPTAAVTLEAFSGDGTDISNGNGARTVTVVGLDANFDEVSATITMNGTNDSTATTQSFIRVYRAYVETVGTYGGANVGTITIRASGGGTTFVTIDAGKGQSQTTHYCVPAGYSLYITHVHISVAPAKAMDVFWYQRQNADDVTVPYSAKRVVHTFEGMASQSDFEYLNIPHVFPEKTDIWFTGFVATGSGQAGIEYAGTLYKE